MWPVRGRDSASTASGSRCCDSGSGATSIRVPHGQRRSDQDPSPARLGEEQLVQRRGIALHHSKGRHRLAVSARDISALHGFARLADWPLFDQVVRQDCMEGDYYPVLSCHYALMPHACGD